MSFHIIRVIKQTWTAIRRNCRALRGSKLLLWPLREKTVEKMPRLEEYAVKTLGMELKQPVVTANPGINHVTTWGEKRYTDGGWWGVNYTACIIRPTGKRIAGHIKGNHTAHISSYENEKRKKCQTWTEKRKLDRSKAISDLKPGARAA